MSWKSSGKLNKLLKSVKEELAEELSVKLSLNKSKTNNLNDIRILWLSRHKPLVSQKKNWKKYLEIIKLFNIANKSQVFKKYWI